MDEFESDSPQPMGLAQAKMGILRRRSTPEQLRDKREQLIAQLRDLDAAIKFLEENPTFEQGLQLISRAL